jgi:ParB-like chromosome segregation protein Spo0J
MPEMRLGPEIVMLPQEALLTHPRNMRRIYPTAHVAAMAASIRENGGVIHALIITPAPDVIPAKAGVGKFLVIDGNLRLSAARTLGAACPLLKCEIVRDVAVVDQLLMMVTANVQRYAVDPVSEGWHYRTLREAEGLTVRQISQRTGVNEVLIFNKILLTQLDEPIQNLIAAGAFTHDPNIARKLLQITDAGLRVDLVTRLAEHQATARAAMIAINRLIESLAPQEATNDGAPGGVTKPAGQATSPDQPMLETAESFAHADAPLATERIPFADLRRAARGMCSACEVRMNALHNRYEEPAWALLAQAASDTCDDCGVRHIAGACASCPGVDMLRRLIRASLPIPSEGRGQGEA